MISGGVNRQAAGPRPQFRTCYLCGQQFGSASIGIHVPQCYSKRLAQWEQGAPATRGSRPKDPSTFNWKNSGSNVQKFNDDQFKEFNANLSPCPNCARTFLPDRLPLHLKGCKPAGGSSTSRAPSSSSRPGSEKGGSRPGSEGRSSIKRGPGIRPVLPTCYLCGQQFGTNSIAIHVPQCYAKKFAQWESGDSRTRGKEPKHPDTVNWRGTNGATVQEQAAEQFQEFVSNLEPCPHCGRRFLSDRLVVHLRSCRPGNTAKRVTSVQPPTAASESSGPAPSMSSTMPVSGSGGGPTSILKKANATVSGGDIIKEENKPQSAGPSDRVNPKRNRAPKTGDGASPPKGVHVCSQCSTAEYDLSSKFCRECGWNLLSKQMADPCSRCSEPIPLGSRFCGTCGEPVAGAAAGERDAGEDNVNAPTVRMTACPACKAICDADGNFCDNCGAALGESEATLTEAESRALTKKKVVIMFCTSCNEKVEDAAAVFCEECGNKLEQRVEGENKVAAKSVATPSPPPRKTPAAAPAAPTSNAPANAAAAPASNGVAKAPPIQPPTKQNTKPSPRVAAAAPPPEHSEIPESAPPGEDVREECGQCGRFFAPDVLERHSRICNGQSKRPTFNMAKQRLADTGISPPSARSAAAKPAAKPAAPKKDWKAESEAFRKAMREARKVDEVIKAGGNARDLPPPTYSENPNYVQCKHCNRRFAPDVAERHIPRCATTMNRPKPPPKRPGARR